MALNYAKLFNRRVTPQSRPIPGSTQVAHSGGGYSWQVDEWTRFDRFLILGAEGGTYNVCRIGTHLFHFAEYVNALRGWGRGLRNAIGRWYLDQEADKLAYQVVKYQQRDSWSHGDLLRLSHPKAPSAEHE